MNVWIQNPFDSLPTEGYRKQRYWLMAEAFVRAGHRVVYWTSDFSHAKKGLRSLRGLRGLEGFELRFVKTLPYRKNVGLARVRSHRAYAREWERAALACADFPDVIIVSAPPVSTGPVGLRLARRFGAKLVVDVQDAWPETFYRLLPCGFQWMARLLLLGMKRTMRRVYRGADLVTGVCDRYEALVKGYGAKEYYRAYLGFQVSGFRFQEAGGGEQGVRVAYVGNMGKSYDLKTVIEGVERLNREGMRATLDVAGFGGTVATSDAVRFHGMLGQEELARLLTQCDVGVIPMKADSFVGIPNKLAEYAAAGLRIVSSLKGETENLLTRYGCGVSYRSGDARSLAEAVRAAVRLDRAQALKMCKEVLDAGRIYPAYVVRVQKLMTD